MIKNYTEESSNIKMEPTKETIQFLFDFSKSLGIVRLKENNFIELNLN